MPIPDAWGLVRKIAVGKHGLTVTADENGLAIYVDDDDPTEPDFALFSWEELAKAKEVADSGE